MLIKKQMMTKMKKMINKMISKEMNNFYIINQILEKKYIDLLVNKVIYSHIQKVKKYMEL